MSLESFTQAYIEAALFSSTDESREDGGDPLDKNYTVSDFSDESLTKIKAECAAFYGEYSHHFSAENYLRTTEYSIDEMAGYDFWMTRVGAGVGFWETDDWQEEVGELLDQASKRAGNRDIYVGDDGKLEYCNG